ncbi:DeoR/GlpR family DNA-binding transcription regulator [Olsenella sp. HMSC062G07]|uniref:DeoR/GlpR family DNA-binding transcription regulator n=1 Tax=Olsenella sp. HMSC062G07 TaxID=1739330 RepID=UPI0008A1374F|nr:DeoR/GlpR family DNA-binding transcription regulator [Olsenella sp. HMSC062G07]OFK23424.1 DeoR family transcriptional regulator [Olsenella sp. HMSC062G07]
MEKRLGLEERRAALFQLVERESSVRVQQLVAEFGVSPVTIRGDLAALERDGKLKRTHGGAVSLSRRLTVSVQEKRLGVQVEAKRLIARRAAALVQDGETLLVDSGTTALELVRALSLHAGLKIVTCDLTIADFIDSSMPSCDVILLGGMVRKAHRYTTGPLALASLASLHADVAFVCPGSYVRGCGLMTDYPSMAELKRALLGGADRRVCLMDASKVGARGLIRFGGLADVETVVMDEDPQGLVAAELEGLDVGLVVA